MDSLHSLGRIRWSRTQSEHLTHSRWRCQVKNRLNHNWTHLLDHSGTYTIKRAITIRKEKEGRRRISKESEREMTSAETLIPGELRVQKRTHFFNKIEKFLLRGISLHLFVASTTKGGETETETETDREYQHHTNQSASQTHKKKHP